MKTYLSSRPNEGTDSAIFNEAMVIFDIVSALLEDLDSKLNDAELLIALGSPTKALRDINEARLLAGCAIDTIECRDDILCR